MLRLLDSDLTLIRLAFRISPEQMDAFDSVYESLLVPVLDRCGFVPAQTSLRPMPEGVFARLFVVETPGALQQKRQVLVQDKEWRHILTELAMQFGIPTPDGFLFYALELYWTRSGAGRLWFSAFGGGVSCFDGQAFQTYTREEGWRTMKCSIFCRIAMVVFGLRPKPVQVVLIH